MSVTSTIVKYDLSEVDENASKARSRRKFRFVAVNNCLVLILLLILVTDYHALLVTGLPLSVQVPDPKAEGEENALTPQFNRVQQSRSPYCRYKSGTFALGDEVITEEPCLKCHCQRTAVVCKLRMCRDMPDPPPPGCIVVHRAKKCCAELVCPDSNRKNSREQRLSAAAVNNTAVMIPQVVGEKGFCIHEGTVYAEGSAMQSSSLCEYCFCIRGEMKCSTPQCVIPMNGCKPKFRSYACCPTNYDCNESNATAILQTIPSSTPIPTFLKGCQVEGRFIHDGEPVLPIQLAAEKNSTLTNMCQTCFCMGGLVRCRPLECDRPIEGCRPITTDGHCCPDRYDCGNDTTTSIPPIILPPILNLQERKSPPAIDVKNRAEIGSREQRRNRDKDDFRTALKTAFEREDEKDNAKEESISFEHGDHGQSSSVSFEGTSEQSSSKLEFESNPDPASETELPETSSSEDNNDMTVIVTEKENEIEEITTTNTPIPVESSSTTTEANSPDVPSSSTFTSAFTETPNPSPTSSIPVDDFVQNSTSIPDTTSISPEEMTTVDDDPSPSPSSSSGIVESVSTSSPTNETNTVTPTVIPTTTLTNLHFIPFGVEDAVVGDPNAVSDFESPFNKYELSDPIKIVYDQNALRSSLIQPTPPKGYVHVPLKTEEIRNPTITIPATENFKEELISKNPVIDIPISTSLYNHGFFGNNGPPIPPNLTGFPGHLFEDPDGSSNSNTKTETGVILHQNQNERSSSTPPTKINLTTPQHGITSIEPTGPPTDPNNPLRTYSKFGVQDTPFYRFGLENVSTNENPTNPPKSADLPISARDDENRFFEPVVNKQGGFNPYADYELEDTYDDSFEKDVQEEQKLMHTYRFENYGQNDKQTTTIRTTTTIKPKPKPISTVKVTTTTFSPKTKRPSSSSHGGFRPAVAFPFMIPKNKPMDSLFNIGLKLSGCNIYGKMYRVGQIILELSGPCLQCECTEVGVQCTELPCRNGSV